MMVLTPSGYKDIADVAPGDELCSFDTQTGAPIVNTLVSKELVTPSTYAIDEVDDVLTSYVINGSYTLCKYQSVWNGRTPTGQVVHASDLSVGDTIFSDANADIPVVSISETTVASWWRLGVDGDHSYIADGLILHNASRYWNYQHTTGTVKTWAITGPTNWGSASNTADGASVPGSADDVFFDGVGGGANDSTLGANISINSLDCTGYANTLTHNSGIVLTDAGAGGTFLLSAGMTYTLGSATSSSISFTGTSGTVNITTNGKTLGNISISGAGGARTMQDAMTCGNITQTKGTFSTNALALTCISYNGATGPATLTITNSYVTITGSGSAFVTNGSSITINSSGSTVDFTYSGSSSRTLQSTTAPTLDTVKISAGSGTFTITGGLTTGAWDMTGYTGALTWNSSVAAIQITGNLTFGSGMTTAVSVAPNSFTIGKNATATTITSNGVTLNVGVFVGTAPGSQLSQTDDFATSDSFRFQGTGTGQTYTTNAHGLTCATMQILTGATSRAITFTNSTIVLTGTGTVWNQTSSESPTMTGSTIQITDSSTTAKTFAGNGKTFGTLEWAKGAGTSTDSITGANTFAGLKNSGTAPFKIQFPSSTTTTLSSASGWNLNGGNGFDINLYSSTPGTQWTLSCTTGTVSASNLWLMDSKAQGGATFNAATSLSVKNNSGWNFTSPNPQPPMRVVGPRQAVNRASTY